MLPLVLFLPSVLGAAAGGGGERNTTGLLLRGHGFRFVASAADVVDVPIDRAWRVRGPHGAAQTRRFKPPRRATVARCDRAVARLFVDPIWGCGRRSAAARAHRQGRWLECGVDTPPEGATVVAARGLLGLDLFSPTFQHAVVNGVAALAGVWDRLLADPQRRLLCHGTTCALAAAALGGDARLVAGRKCETVYFPSGLVAVLSRGDIPPRGAYDALIPPYVASLLSGANAAYGRRLLVYASRNHDAFKGKRTVANESAVIARLRAVADGTPGLTFHLFRFESQADSARIFADAEVVVGPHGGALANVVFCRESAAVVEIMPERHARLYFAGVAYARRLRFYAFQADRFLSYDAPDIVVDPDALAALVRVALRERGDDPGD